MGGFDSIPDIEGRLEDFEFQCVIDFWGDPVRNMLDQSIEEDVFEPYKKGKYYHSLIRLETYISLAILKMILQKCPSRILPPSRKVPGAFLADFGPIIRKLHKGLGTHLNWFKECFKKVIPHQLIRDLHIIRKLRNAYAHRFTPVQIIFTSHEHEEILQALRNTWLDLRKEYCKVVIYEGKRRSMK